MENLNLAAIQTHVIKLMGLRTEFIKENISRVLKEKTLLELKRNRGERSKESLHDLKKSVAEGITQELNSVEGFEERLARKKEGALLFPNGFIINMAEEEGGESENYLFNYTYLSLGKENDTNDCAVHMFYEQNHRTKIADFIKQAWDNEALSLVKEEINFLINKFIEEKKVEIPLNSLAQELSKSELYDVYNVFANASNYQKVREVIKLSKPTKEELETWVTNKLDPFLSDENLKIGVPINDFVAKLSPEQLVELYESLIGEHKSHTISKIRILIKL